MPRYEDIQDLLRQVSLVDILLSFGKDVGHVRNGMCLSPFREEDTPSFRILRRNGIEVWADYGASLTESDRRAGKKVHGGGVLDLVMELGHMSRSEAVDYVASVLSCESLATGSGKRHEKSEPEEGRYQIESVSDTFTRTALLGYACGTRMIPREVLERWCSEVRYHIRGCVGKTYYKIGFPNDDGGWVLRGPGSGPYSKVSTCSAITTIGGDGSFRPSAPSADCVFVFEGFMDYLSWMAWSGRSLPGHDICVLNSVSNLNRCVSWISAHQSAGVCFDNDDAGRNAFKELRSLCPGVDVRDCSGAYAEYRDLNDMYMAVRNREKSKGQGIK